MDWVNALGLLILIAGHTELQVTLVNRLHAGRISLGTLRHIRHVHDALIPLFPLLVFFAVGIGGPELLRGGRWTALPWGWKACFCACGLGFLGLIWSALRWNLRKPPGAQLVRRSRIEDIAALLGAPPLGPGRYQRLARLPCNEIFQLEVTELELHFPALPPCWDGLSIAHLTDVHFLGTIDRPYFERVADIAAGLKADLVVFTGDLIDNAELVSWIPAVFGRLSAPLGCFYVLGNHDWPLDPAVTRRALDRLGWHDVSGHVLTINHRGKTMAIGGSELPWMGTAPDFSQVPADFRLLLSHTPDNLAWADRAGIDLMLSGHNHGGQVVLPVIGPIYSPSRHGTYFSQGLFQAGSTRAYVSRGIAAQHPFRWNCRPELVKLTLRTG